MVRLLAFRALPLFSALLVGCGLAWRAWRHYPGLGSLRAATPAELARRLFLWGEASGRWEAAAAWMVRLCLALVIIRHLRYVLYPVPAWVLALQGPGVWAGHLLPPALAALLLRHTVIHPEPGVSVRERLWALLLASSLTGLALRHLARPDVLEVKAAALGLVRGDLSGPLPGGDLLLVHLLLANGLAIGWAVLRLLPAPGVLVRPRVRERAAVRPLRAQPVPLEPLEADEGALARAVGED